MGLRFFGPLSRIKKTFSLIATAGLVATTLVATATVAEANSKYAGVVVDAKTGKVLYQDNAHARRFPASTTKIMTLYVLFEEMEAGRMSLNTRMRVSKYASQRPPTKLWLKAGGTLRVKDAIFALITRSANDASTVIAEHISGSEAAFARRMTATARRIGMQNTVFKNPHGLPNSKQVTTAYDLSLLGRAIQDRFPKYYKYFNTRSYKYGKTSLRNHNRLLGSVRGVDGIKTGYTRASGFNLVTNVERDGRHIVAVVMGGRTGRSRDAHMVDLINRYLGKASRGPRTAPLLLAGSPTSLPQTLAALPNSKPSFGSATASTPVMAYAQASTTPSTKPGGDPIAQMLESHESLAPIANPEEPIKVASVAPTALPAAAPVQNAAQQQVPAASAEPEPSWHVQISASASQEQAIAMLEKARAATGGKLKRYSMYTEPVRTKNQTLYRARFIGFETKTAAWDACKSLKRANYSCYAVYQ
ncbi:D-alanyl-D-alanine carboxypeptidase [Pseudovibrio sp. SPO723]|uniref:D-alanyl-D-alanine carboxypeptidase n=1 Tax=Nesiotobacter zosterae TaxID=392721 RepID=UPI0029C13272|nr:D-alanyl-D-alanine carboxypeptidase [Pseudovibrio sp. SPO723]MDX5594486.1 D-alanyl-D-alanine carboxypeptidase [Pseudovibrio sp. SPO723]